MNSIKEILNKIKKLKVLVIGDIMLDEHLWCNVSRISPEAPVPVAKIEKVTLMPGGAANVANNIRSLGAKVDLIGIIGNDSSGIKLLKTLDKNNIGKKYIICDKNKATILKSRIIAHHQHVVRVDRDDIEGLSGKETKKIILQYKKIIKSYDAVIISDYSKGFLNEELSKNLIKIARKYKKIIAVDSKGTCYTKYKYASVITPNVNELQSAMKIPICNDKHIINSAVKMKKQLKLNYIVVTISEEGMTLIDKNNRAYKLSANAKDVYDITGAGDTVIAVLTLGLACGLDIINSAKLSNCAAGIVVSKVGTSVAKPEELIMYYEKQNSK